MRHTGIDNTLAPLFEREATLRVATGVSNVSEHADTRFRLAQWPSLRDAVCANLDSLLAEYTPFGYTELVETEIVARHLERVHEMIGLHSFVAGIRKALTAFDAGMQRLPGGTIALDLLATLHGALVDAYSSERIFPDRRRM